MVDGGATQDSQDAISFGLCVREPSQDDWRRTLRFARTHPPEASKVLHDPLREMVPALQNEMNGSGDKDRVTPAQMAVSHSAEFRLRLARCSATREEEHAVSTLKFGPWRPRKYDTRPAPTQAADPRAV